MSDYGSVTGVAALATTWTRGGLFYNENIPLGVKPTNPPLSTVTDWLADVSAFMNGALKESFFITPIDANVSPGSFRMASAYVNELVADLVAARNNRGRFYSDDSSKGTRMTRFGQIQADLLDWVIGRTEAFKADGMAQQPLNTIRYNIPTLYIVEDQ